MTDNDDATKSDNVTVTVESANQAPVAKAGPDQRVMEGDTVTLDGSASTDPDGTITAYVWKEGSTTLSTKVSFDKIFSVGTHTVTLTVTDNDGATRTDSMSVTVTSTPPPADTTSPVITLNGANPMSIMQGSTFSDPGASATDTVDGDVPVTVSGTVNTSKVGSYTLTYTAEDSAGNKATKTRTVNVTAGPDTTPPVITLNGADPMSIVQGSTFTDPGATATDNVDGTVSVTKSGTVDTSKVGSYTLTYAAEDSAGNKVSKTRTVNVTAESLPRVTDPDWFKETIIDEKTEYTIKDGETSVVLDSGAKDDFDVKANDDMIFFTSKDPSVIGNCQVKAYITMKNDGTVRTGYTYEGSDCSNDIDTFAPGTIVTVDSNSILRIDAPLTSDLVLGGK